MLELFNHSIFPTKDIQLGHYTPMYITQHTSSQWCFQHQEHLMSLSLSTSTSYHLNDIINVNIISSQWHYQHQQHLVSMALSTITTSSHFNIIINNNITSYHIIINNNIILISILSSITTSPHITLSSITTSFSYQYYHQ